MRRRSDIAAATLPTLCVIALMMAELTLRAYSNLLPEALSVIRLLLDLLLISPLYARRAAHFYAQDSSRRIGWKQAVRWRWGLWRRLTPWAVLLMMPGTLLLGLARTLRASADGFTAETAAYFTATVLCGVGLLLVGAGILWTRYLRLLPAVYLLEETHSTNAAFRRAKRLTRKQMNYLMRPMWWWSALYPRKKAAWLTEQRTRKGEEQIKLKTLAREGKKARI